MSKITKPKWHCYWLKPQKVMIGEYPSSRALANVRERMREFLEIGITFFLDLTEEGEMPSYLPALKEEAKVMGKTVEYVRMPVRDIGIPSREYMIKILDTIDKAIADNHTVYVHCRGGIGRISVVSGCFYVRHGMSGEQALEALQGLFLPGSNGIIPKAPGTFEQQHFIRTWNEKDDHEENYQNITEDASIRLRRYKGCLIGLAICDALGIAVESLSIRQFKPITGMLGGGRFNLKPGEWSDATALALCVAESLIESNGFNESDLMNRFLMWCNNGHLSCTGTCVGIEYSISRALEVFEQTGKPISEVLKSYSADNTSLVRVAPIAMYYRKNYEAAIRFAEKNSLLTHCSKTADDACKYFTGILIGALSGVNKKMLLSDLYSPVPGLWKKEKLQPAIESIASGSFKRRYPPSIKSTNYVVDSLEAALWAFYRSANFREGALMLANLGDDSSTTCAIYGQLAGAVYGVSDIPTDWLKKLSMKNKIEEFVTQLFNLSEQLNQ